MAGCPLCNHKAITTRQDNSSRTIYNCDNCGVYVISDLSVKQVQKHQNEVYAFLHHRKLAASNDTVLISYDKAKLDKGYLQITVDQIVDLFPKSFSEQMEMALVNLSLLSAYPGEEIKVEGMDSFPVFYLKTANFESLSFIIKAMMKEDLIEVNYYSSSFFPCGIVISPKGWDVLSSMEKKKKPVRKKVLLLYNSTVEATADNVILATTAMAKECSLLLTTGDLISKSCAIGSQLAASIRVASYILVDFSSALPECYYALGYAQALKKPVLLTCHEKERRKLPLDAERLGVVFWSEQKQLQMEQYNFVKVWE